MNNQQEITIFSELWPFVRDLYAPTTSVPEAVRKTVNYATGNGHDAVTTGKRFFMIDGELFEIRKNRGWSHFDLWQHNIQICKTN